MSYTETHIITLDKPAKRQLRGNVIEDNAAALIGSIINKSMSVRGWMMAPNLGGGSEDGPFWTKVDGDDTPYIYKMSLTATFARQDDKKPDTFEFASLVRTLDKRGSSLAFGAWSVSEVDGKPWTRPADDDNDISANVTNEYIGYADLSIPDNWDDFFGHLYGLDPHIARIKTAIQAAQMSDWRNRFHCALVGPPGCGKSDICASLKRALGDDAVMEYDATATTAAGAIKDLSEREILPRVVVVEEIEKADEKALSFLLALCDLRGEIRKTTARGSIQRDTKVMVVATVNDVPLFEKMLAGALASRFANKIWFKRPSRETLSRILTREIRKINGDPGWIAPALDYCEERGITDPRQVIALALCGREMLVSGAYQKMLAETSQEAAE